MPNFIAPVNIGFKIAKTVSNASSSYKELTGNETPEEVKSIQDFNTAVTSIAAVKVATAIAQTTLDIVQIVHNYNIKTTRFGHIGQDQIDQDAYQDHLYQNNMNIARSSISGVAIGFTMGMAGGPVGAIFGGLLGGLISGLESHINNSINDSMTIDIQNQQYQFNVMMSQQQSAIARARIGSSAWNNSRY